MKTLRFAIPTSFVALGVVLWACASLDSIDGSKVPPIGSEDAPPSCGDVCARLAQLCGFAPTSCVETCTSETDGWDDEHLVCAGAATNCRDALSCANADTGDGGEEAGDDGGADETDDAGDAGGEGEDASDASLD